jgi:hypothetical protein
MEECKICYDIYKTLNFKTIKCGHTLCKKCYLQLIICECPFCRHKIEYSKMDQNKRRELGVETNPDFSSNIIYNPRDFVYSHNYNNSTLSSTTNSVNDIESPDFALNHNTRNRQRRILRDINSGNRSNNNANNRRRNRSKRRRKLTDEEIKEKRRIINLKKKMKYIRKEGRLRKEIAWYNNQID